MLLTLEIQSVLQGAARARVVRLALGGRRFPYRAGQALMIATHGCATRRPYSIAAGPEATARQDCLELLVGVDSQGSPGPHLVLEPKTLVDVEGPVGRFSLPDVSEERRFAFIAGGTGIAPLRAMLHQALERAHRQVVVVYSARTPRDFAYASEFVELAAAGRIELRRTITRDTAGEPWADGQGRLGAADLAPLVDHATLYFVCGPASFVVGVRTLLETCGVPGDRVKTEEWLAPPPPAPAPA